MTLPPFRLLTAWLVLLGVGCGLRAAPTPEPPVKSLKITVLSTMLAGNPMFRGIGEWGFAALVEVDGKRLLFDAGLRPGTVLNNARELELDLSDITTLVLSHNHLDHVGGLESLRAAYRTKNPAALTTAYVGRGIFWSRGRDAEGQEDNDALRLKPQWEAAGVRFVECDGPREILPGVWLTGPVRRTYPEKNYGTRGQVQLPEGDWAEDMIPEDSALVFDTVDGLVVLTGCGHAGVVNTAAYAREVVRDAPVKALLGGFHLLVSSDRDLAWTAEKFQEFGVRYILAAHCTGLEASYRLRGAMNLPRENAAVGAVGSTFELGKGINPLALAR